MDVRKLLFALILLPCLGIMLMVAGRPGEATVEAQDEGVTSAGVLRDDVKVVKFDVSPRLDEVDISALPPMDGNLNALLDPPSGLEGAFGPQDADGALQTTYPASVEGLIPEPLVSFNGPPNIQSVSPPDPVGDVGPNHYVAMANLSTQIFDKQGTSLFGPVPNNAFWAGFGGACQAENAGDPIVLHDQLSDRWYLTQFTSNGPTYYICLAVSTSPDPTGTYYRWAISTGTNFPDYPKYGIWPDAFYMSTREFAGASFGGVGAYALERADLIAGDPNPTIIAFLVSPNNTPMYTIGDGLLPSDLDGDDLPPAGSPNYYVGSMDNGGPYGAPSDALNIWEFDVDFTTPANSTFALINTVPIAPYDTVFPCSPGSRDCIPQPNTTQKVDILSYRQRPMHRLAYRNFGTHESLVTNQSVEAAPGMAGMRWWEIRDPGGTPTIYQEGTYAPGVNDGIHRWMGSIAQDSAGNMALGYSASSSTVFPSVWYTGRLSGDPLGTLPQGEGSIVDGTGSQTGSPRWGDYTSMNVDPIDDCTFWYVNQWVPVTSAVGWQLRIGAFRFDECGTPGFYLSANPDELQACVGDAVLSTIDVGQVAGFTDPVTLSATNLPADVNANFNPNPVVPPDSSVLTLSVGAAAPAGDYTIEVVGTAPTATESTTLDLAIYSEAPSAPTLVAPPNGAVGVSRTPVLEWNAPAQAATYEIEIATDPAFTNVVVSDTTAGTSYQVQSALNTLETYYWRVRAVNECGNGAWSEVWSFTTMDTPPILLVDDDDNSPDVRPFYQDALTALGLAWDEWDTNNSDNEPTASELSAYEVVIWFTGDEFGGSAGPGTAGEAALAAWLDQNAGHRLLLTSQDYHYDRGLTPFMINYLGAASVNDDTGDYSSVTGVADPFTGLSYSLVYPFTDFSDIITPGAGEVAFVGNNQNNAALVHEGADWCTSFWVFPWEAISTAADREEALEAFLSGSCGGAAGPTATPSATGPATSIQLSALESGNSGSLPWLLLSLVGIAGLAGVAWFNGRRMR